MKRELWIVTLIVEFSSTKAMGKSFDDSVRTMNSFERERLNEYFVFRN